MKKTMIAGAAAIALSAPAYAELEGDLSLSYDSQYNYRGMNDLMSQVFGGATDDAITADLNVAYGLNDQWSLVAGATIATVSDGAGLDHNRYRGGVRYANDGYSLEVGYQYQDIDFLNISRNTSEIYLNAAMQCPLTGGMLNLFVAHDIDLLDGTYAELSLKKGWELNDTVGVDVTVGVAYSFDYWDNLIGTGSDWNHAYLTVGLPVKATDNLTVTPYVTYSQGFGALDVVGAPLIEEDEQFVLGVRASVKF